MLIIIKKYSRIIYFISMFLILSPSIIFSAEPPDLGDPLSQSMSLKTEEIIGLSSYKRLQKYNYINQQPKFGLTKNYQIQHYKKGGGYKKWHFENAATNVLDRCLVFMTFLNDIDDGGTDFLYQNLTIPAKKGLTLIWPAYWTHTHKSQVTKTKEKYIITGWMNYV